MRIIITTFILTLLPTLMANAGTESEFSYENDDFAGINLNYRMSIINSDIPKPEVIVIYLHGGSAQGNDNKAQLQTQAVDDIYNYLKKNNYHARMLVPQAPEGHQWDEDFIPAMKALSDKYNIAGKSESYILGGSMGGYGVWNMLTAYPEYFSGAMPVACNTPKAPAENYCRTRIYSVVGRNDPQRNINAIQSFFNRLEASNGKGAELDVENDWDHRETCELSFTPQRLNWLFTTGASSITEVYTEALTSFSTIYDIWGHIINNPIPGHIYIIDGKKFYMPQF